VADGGLVFAKCGDVLLVLDDDGVHEIEDIDFLENLCVRQKRLHVAGNIL